MALSCLPPHTKTKNFRVGMSRPFTHDKSHPIRRLKQRPPIEQQSGKCHCPTMRNYRVTTKGKKKRRRKEKTPHCREERERAADAFFTLSNIPPPLKNFLFSCFAAGNGQSRKVIRKKKKNATKAKKKEEEEGKI